MNNSKLTRIILIIICILAVIASGISIFVGRTDKSSPDNDISIEETYVVEIPEGEPILTEDPTEPPETEPPTEAPTEPEFPMKGIVNTDRLNVREKPDINEFVIKQLAVGTEIEVLEIKILDAIPWGRIEDGWVNLRYVDLEGADYTVKVTYNMEDLHNLALINFIEAGQDSCCNVCRLRICDVVLNRIEDDRWPGEDTIAEVLLSPTQFAQLSKTGLVWPARAKSMMEQHAIERAYMIAEEIMLGNHSDVYQQGYVWYMGAPQTRDYFRCPDCNIYFSR